MKKPKPYWVAPDSTPRVCGVDNALVLSGLSSSPPCSARWKRARSSTDDNRPPAAYRIEPDKLLYGFRMTAVSSSRYPGTRPRMTSTLL